MIAALYIDPRGLYPTMPGVDCWDEDRDARRYAGPHPVVAHPPCGAWGRMRQFHRANDRDCAPRAVEQVRVFGGVLEHPAHSLLWVECGLPRPGELPDHFGGFAIHVDQVSWGHVARKPTWLYVVGVDRAIVEAGIRTGGTPTHWVRASTKADQAAGRGAVPPPGIKMCSKEQRRRTPQAFAEWLVSLARMSRSASMEAA